MDMQKSLKRFVQKLPERFEVAEGLGTICGVLLDLDEATGLCRTITRLRVDENTASPRSRSLSLGDDGRMDLTLVIGNKNYSSWSLRPWLMLKQASVPFREVSVSLYTDTSRAEIGKYSPSARCRC